MGRNVKITSGRGAVLEMWKERGGNMGVKLDDKVDIAVGSFVETDMLRIQEHLNKAYPVRPSAQKWIPADQPPEGAQDKWTAPVVVVTDLGNAFNCSYFHGKDGGVWQRPSTLLKGERIAFWMPLPKGVA